MSRRRFSEREVLETLWHQGFDLRCFRCAGQLFSATELKPKIEREHILEIALGGEDRPINCRYSCARCHKRVTNGTKATSAGSSKHRIAKTKRLIGKPRKRKGKKMQSRPFSKQQRKFPKRQFGA